MRHIPAIPDIPEPAPGTRLRPAPANTPGPVFFALRYMYGPGSRGLLSPRLDFMSVSILLVGIGSFLFHATLRQPLQFADDLSMIVLGASMLHGVFTVRQSAARQRLVSVLLGISVIGFSGFYVWSGKIIYHFAAFTSQMLLILARCIYLFHFAPGFPEEKMRGWKWEHRCAVAVFLLGYLLWNIDLEMCAELRSLRAWVGLPWAFGLELHGWWHVLTAVGADMFIQVVRDIHALEVEGKNK